MAPIFISSPATIQGTGLMKNARQGSLAVLRGCTATLIADLWRRVLAGTVSEFSAKT